MGQHTAVVVKSYGDPEGALCVDQVETPAPARGEVLVRVLLRPVNPADLASIAGYYPGFKPKTLDDPKNPAVPGLEGYGVVEKLGDGAGRFSVGQRVVGAPYETLRGSGTWQQYVVVSETQLVAVPDGVLDETAAQFLVNPVTAVGLLETLQIPPGEFLLQTAANSVLGKMVIQLAKHKGIKTINVVRRKGTFAELKELGADEVISSNDEDVTARVKELTGGKGAYAAIDAVSGEVTTAVISAMRDTGTLLVYGALEGMKVQAPTLDLLCRSVIVTGFWLSNFLVHLGDRRSAVLEEVMQLLEEGIIHPQAGEVFPLERVKEAVAASVQTNRGGKVLLSG